MLQVQHQIQTPLGNEIAKSFHIYKQQLGMEDAFFGIDSLARPAGPRHEGAIPTPAKKGRDPMTTKLKSTLTSLAGVVLLAAAPAVAVAQTPDQQQEGHAHKGMHGTMAMGDSESTMDCQKMMAKMKQMHAKQQQMQTELDELASRMNATSGTTQQETMAELLTKLVEQRGMKQAMMQKMQPMMMQHMMGHMQSSDEGGMSGCPMMQKMHGEKGAEASAGDDEHSQHH